MLVCRGEQCNAGPAEPGGEYRGRHSRNLLAQLAPRLERDTHKHLDHHRIELATGAAHNLIARRFKGGALAIRPVRGHRVERVRYGKDSRPQWNLLAAETPRIALAVEALLMRVDDLGRLFEERNLAHHLVSTLTVLLHDEHLRGVELSRLQQNAVGSRNL